MWLRKLRSTVVGCKFGPCTRVVARVSVIGLFDMRLCNKEFSKFMQHANG